MGSSRVPQARPRKNVEIERIANQWLEKCFPDCLREPQPVPVADFLEFDLREHLDIRLQVRALPAPCEAVTIPGGPNKPTWIYMTETQFRLLTDDDPRTRFTGGHEAGHGILHAREINEALVNGTFQGYFRRSELPAYIDPEHQADHFAGCFLMPRQAVQRAVQLYGTNPSVLAPIFRVSRKAMSVRLGVLGLR